MPLIMSSPSSSSSSFIIIIIVITTTATTTTIIMITTISSSSMCHGVKLERLGTICYRVARDSSEVCVRMSPFMLCVQTNDIFISLSSLKPFPSTLPADTIFPVFSYHSVYSDNAILLVA